ncbi:unnamed protein product [Phytophthora fragariaefolia]|uniref:Unnamed protein product n=1 Tax=Phytophthora fragariaefolia TaxID=1490495 RepID=A0A9W7D2Z5_9STRA|nr:unnamed protein product [Phytophthora fragariaefolia]
MPARRKSVELSIKRQAIEWIASEGGGIPSRAEAHFRALGWRISAAAFRQWWHNRDQILAGQGNRRRLDGGGRRPVLGEAEDVLVNLIYNRRLLKEKVTREWIAAQARQLFHRGGTRRAPDPIWDPVKQNVTYQHFCVFEKTAFKDRPSDFVPIRSGLNSMDSLQGHPPNDASLPSSVPHDDTLDPHSDEASDSEYDDSSDSNWSGGSTVESIAHDATTRHRKVVKKWRLSKKILVCIL